MATNQTTLQIIWITNLTTSTWMAWEIFLGFLPTTQSDHCPVFEALWAGMLKCSAFTPMYFPAIPSAA